MKTNVVDMQIILQAKEVEWYRRFGRYPHHRVISDGSGREYVIGDWGWNREANSYEVIEPEMSEWVKAHMPKLQSQPEEQTASEPDAPGRLRVD
jgi:hypothetical protein